MSRGRSSKADINISFISSQKHQALPTKARGTRRRGGAGDRRPRRHDRPRRRSGDGGEQGHRGAARQHGHPGDLPDPSRHAQLRLGGVAPGSTDAVARIDAASSRRWRPLGRYRPRVSDDVVVAIVLDFQAASNA